MFVRYPPGFAVGGSTPNVLLTMTCNHPMTLQCDDPQQPTKMYITVRTLIAGAQY
jgi:hypothetical protein